MALLFDLDGVIVDSMPVHAEVWRTYLERAGVSGDDIVRRMHGKRNDEIVRSLFGAHLSEEEVFAHGAAKEALYRDTIKPRIRECLVPGVEEFLARHTGMPMGLATNAEPENAAFVLRHCGLSRYFQVVVDGHQVRRAKPEPDIYLRAAELLGADPASCIIFEDSPTGVRAARRAGARVVGVNTSGAQLPPVDLLIRNFLDPGLESWLQAALPRT